MKRRVCGGLAALVAVLCSGVALGLHGGDVPSGVTLAIEGAFPQAPGYHVLKGKAKIGAEEFPIAFGVFLPESYFKSTAPFPVLCTMHNVVSETGGADGNPGIVSEGLALLMLKDTGADTRHSGEWPAKRVNVRTDAAHFIGLVPQCPKDKGFERQPMTGVLVELINLLERTYRVDGDRVYLTGFSYGGTCTWNVAQQYPQRFAAIVPLSSRVAANVEQAPAALRDVGIWAGVGEHDGDFRTAQDRNAEVFRAAKHPNFHYTVIKGGGHHCYQAIYGNPAFWTWLYAQRRKQK